MQFVSFDYYLLLILNKIGNVLEMYISVCWITANYFVIFEIE